MTAAKPSPPADPWCWLTTPELARLTGATFRQLDHWLRLGYIRTGAPAVATSNPAIVRAKGDAVLSREATP